ncbi:unnamed protein product [Heligmosomoides polygyrus]|uniref:PUB domain-containing protein n=1 Tax=Heligmosomoides polygyrus TaxID=6339 RepID=A0A183GSJ2_HELPZ|nr:unnamed protein product [Heligmosomoides polygyrus]
MFIVEQFLELFGLSDDVRPPPQRCRLANSSFAVAILKNGDSTLLESFDVPPLASRSCFPDMKSNTYAENQNPGGACEFSISILVPTSAAAPFEDVQLSLSESDFLEFLLVRQCPSFLKVLFWHCTAVLIVWLSVKSLASANVSSNNANTLLVYFLAKLGSK